LQKRKIAQGVTAVISCAFREAYVHQTAKVNCTMSFTQP